MLCERKAEKDRKESEPKAKNWWSEVIESSHNISVLKLVKQRQSNISAAVKVKGSWE